MWTERRAVAGVAATASLARYLEISLDFCWDLYEPWLRQNGWGVRAEGVGGSPLADATTRPGYALGSRVPPGEWAAAAAVRAER